MSSKVLVIGSLNMDFTTKSESLPRPGETLLAQDFKMAPGGKGANQAVAASRLGANVDFIGRAGDDFIGERLLKNLREEGVGVKGVKIDSDAHSGIALIMVDEEGENIITSAPGANIKISKRDIDRSEDLIEEADVVLSQLKISIEVLEHLLKKASSAKVILDPSPYEELSKDIFEGIDIILPNEIEAEALTGVRVEDVPTAKKAGKKLLKRGVNSVIITLGANGAVFVGSDRSFHVESPDVDVVDTTGAGDAFCGALANYINRFELEKALEYSVAAGALATTKMGAQEALPTESELKKFL